MKHKIKTQSEPTQFYISERISVKAHLLHPYVAQPGFIPYQKWVDSLQGIRDSHDAAKDLRIFPDRDGELAVNPELARVLAHRVCYDHIPAFAATLVEEGELHREDPDYINNKLSLYSALHLDKGNAHAKILHHFLEINESFDEWLTWLMEEERMQYGRDFNRIRATKSGQVIQLTQDDGVSPLMLKADFAVKLIMDTPTPRGQRIKQLIIGHLRFS